MKDKKQTLQSQRDFYFAFMGESPCYDDHPVTIEELDEAISDCYEMLQYSIEHNDKEETSYWRRLLQENKVQRRMLVA